MKTGWFCEVCKEMDTVELDRHVDVWSAFQKIMKSHRLVSKQCKGDRYSIRVKNISEKKMTDEELHKMIKDLAKSMETDPKVREKIEEFRRTFGTLTAEDLSIIINV